MTQVTNFNDLQSKPGQKPVVEGTSPRTEHPENPPTASQRESVVTAPTGKATQMNSDSLVASFVAILGGNPDKVDFNNLTLQSLKDAGANISTELFDLIDNGMKLKDERDGSADGKISQVEIGQFMENVVTFMQMAGLNPNDNQDLVRVISLYNRANGNYTKLSISDYQNIRDTIEQRWGTWTNTDPYGKAAQIIGAQSSQIQSVLDKMAQKVAGKQYKDLDEESQKNILASFLLVQNLKIDVDELYGIKEKISQMQGSSNPTDYEEKAKNVGEILISAGEEGQVHSGEFENTLKSALEIRGKTYDQFKEALRNASDPEQFQKLMLDMKLILPLTRSKDGSVLTPKAVVKNVVIQTCRDAMIFNLPVTDSELNEYFAKNPDTDRSLPQNVEIAKSKIREEKLSDPKHSDSIIKEISKMNLKVDAKRILEIANKELAKTNDSVTLEEIQQWVNKAKEIEAELKIKFTNEKQNKGDIPNIEIVNYSYNDGRFSMEVDKNIDPTKLKVTTADNKTVFIGEWKQENGKWVFISKNSFTPGIKHVYYDNELIAVFNVEEKEKNQNVNIEFQPGMNQIIVYGENVDDDDVVIKNNEGDIVDVTKTTNGSKIMVDISKLGKGEYSIKVGENIRKFIVALNEEGKSELAQSEGGN